LNYQHEKYDQGKIEDDFEEDESESDEESEEEISEEDQQRYIDLMSHSRQVFSLTFYCLTLEAK